MKKYCGNKDSGLEWIGNIPVDWVIARFKNFVVQITTPSACERKIGLENIESATGKFIETDSDFSGNGIHFMPDDIIYGKLRPYLQKVWKAEFEGNAVGDFYVFRCSNAVPSFVKYIMLSPNFTSLANSSTNGAKMPRVPIDFIMNLKWCLPSLEEQQYISDYLDFKIGQIDSSISSVIAQIEDLNVYRKSVIRESVTKGLNPDAPMKDSGIEWVGEIPAAWKCMKTKRLFSIIAGATPDTTNEQYWDGDIPWITPADYKSQDYYVSGGKRKITNNGYDSCATTLVPKGSIIFSKRAPIGSVALASNSLCTNQGCLSCVPKEELDTRFFYYVMSSFTEAYDMLGTGTTFKEISANTFSDVQLPCPEFEEQQSIANSLDARCAKIDAAIKALEQQCNDLKALRQSIINEAVTGKTDVSNE